jgi:hypothetical protein
VADSYPVGAWAFVRLWQAGRKVRQVLDAFAPGGDGVGEQNMPGSFVFLPAVETATDGNARC